MTPAEKRLTPEELKELCDKVYDLRIFTKMTGSLTGDRIRALTGALCTDDLAALGRLLRLKPRELPNYKNPRTKPIYDRKQTGK